MDQFEWMINKDTLGPAPHPPRMEPGQLLYMPEGFSEITATVKYQEADGTVIAEYPSGQLAMGRWLKIPPQADRERAAMWVWILVPRLDRGERVRGKLVLDTTAKVLS